VIGVKLKALTIYIYSEEELELSLKFGGSPFEMAGDISEFKSCRTEALVPAVALANHRQALKGFPERVLALQVKGLWCAFKGFC